MKKAILTLLVLAAVSGGAYAYYQYTKTAPEPTVATAVVTQGDISDRVGATGTLQAVTTVQVGTQVSGTIQELHADFNSLVRKGQVLARLDPSLFQTQIEQARANLIRAQADLERLKVTLEDARVKLTRTNELWARQLVSRSELEAAEVAVRSAEAQIRSSEAQVTQAQASLNQNQVNLQHTVIEAPIDGLVISRNVDVGQTVAASMQAPTLFILAADLTKMQVLANLDESDVGRIRPGQRVLFRVDAYPAEDFTGTVSQVRLQPQIVQNVVTYSTVIDVPNPELKLKPGMTANVNVEIARRTNVVRVPNAALRFRPTNDIFAALGQTPPEGGLPGNLAAGGSRGSDPGRGGQAGGQGRSPAAEPARESQTGRPEPGTPKASGAGEEASPQASAGRGNRGEFGRGTGRGGGFGGGGGAGQDPAQMMERLQGLPPEQREQMLQRMRARGFDPTAGGPGGGGADRPRGRGEQPSAPALTARASGATTIDALFGPLPPIESVGRVWVYEDKRLRPVSVRLGITDGQATELIEGDLPPGAALVTNVSTGNEVRPTTGNPFMGGPPRGGFPGGGFPGGGFPGGGGGGGGRGR
jgi:HlyD family secretion protein